MIPRSAGIVYFSVPKVACTSIKSAMYELEHGVPPREHVAEGRIDHVQLVYPSYPFERYRREDLSGLATFAVVRDPVSRIASCYRSKVLTGRLLKRGLDEAIWAAEGLAEKPDFDEFVDRLDAYREASAVIRHHSETLDHFLGPDPDFFTRVFGMHELPVLATWIEDRTGRRLQIGHENRSRSARKDVSDRSRRALEARFESDDAYARFYG